MAGRALSRRSSMPLTPGLQRAFHDLFVAENGDDRCSSMLDPAWPPRPWDPATYHRPPVAGGAVGG